MSENKTLESEDTKFELRELEPQDIDSLVEVAKEWVRNRLTGRVEEKELNEVRSHLVNREYKYFVLRNIDGNAVGCCGIREPEEGMLPYKTEDSCKELVDVFLSAQYHGKGLGYAMLSYAVNLMRESGCREIIWNSGPRYRDTAWGFYREFAGEPIAVAEKYYGRFGDAPVWRMLL